MAESNRKGVPKKTVDQTAEASEHVRYANQLLDREVPAGYAEEWTELLMHEKQDDKGALKNTLVIFRLGDEWLSLSALVFVEVAENRVVHRLPHKSGRYLLGLVNVRGRLRLCASLTNLLEIGEATKDRLKRKGVYERMIVVERKGEQWVFPVEEVWGIFQVDPKSLENAPVTVSKSTANFLKGMIHWNKQLIGLIDEELLFNSLRRLAL